MDSNSGDSPKIHLHLVSDSTGETLFRVARACSVQFAGVEFTNHTWSLVRSRAHLDKVFSGIVAHPGPILHSILDEAIREQLLTESQKLGVPAIAVLDPIINCLSSYLGIKSSAEPGKQHSLDADYFNRIEAMNFTLAHDDGQSSWSLGEADVILVGVSRTSKSPTCMYLANRGLKAANVPFVPDIPLPPSLFTAGRATVFGLTNDPNRLVQLRRNRLRSLGEEQDTDYTEIESVRRETAAALRLFTEQGWAVIDVARRSIEETAAEIMQIRSQRNGEND
ncbi:MAG: pyruvate, water dikinase regulatory protein [Candidatus Pacebacteria bacterium]|nr:pyruvate, water dikinase regulatory protein [Candidatus Paceibacterota bacterium]